MCGYVCVSYDMRPGEKREISRLISIEALAFTGHLIESFQMIQSNIHSEVYFVNAMVILKVL